VEPTVSDNETTEFWNDVRKEKSAAKAKKRDWFAEVELPKLIARGHSVKDINKVNPGTQYRVDGWLDLWPTGRRYHDLKTGRRGGFAQMSAVDLYNRLLLGI
jgi:hypothetical protein